MDRAHFWFDQTQRLEPFEYSLKFTGTEHLQWSAPNWANNNDMRYVSSFWVKRGKLGGTQNLLTRNYTTNTSGTRFEKDFYNHIENGNGGTDFQLCRDTNAWYHIFVKCTTQSYQIPGTGEIWINGVKAYGPGKKLMGMHASNTRYRIGTGGNTLGNYFDGKLADWHQVMGTGSNQDLTHEDFGRFNDHGVWVPKVPNVGNYGSHGWHLDFSDPDDIGADRSGNGNNFTPTNFDFSVEEWDPHYSHSTDTPNRNTTTFNYVDITPNDSRFYSLANNQIQRNGVSSGSRSWGATPIITALPNSGKYIWVISGGEQSWTPSSNTSSGLNLGIAVTRQKDLSLDYSSQFPNTTINCSWICRGWRYDKNRILAAQASDGDSYYENSTIGTDAGFISSTINAFIVMCYDANTRNLWYGYVNKSPGNTGFTGVIEWIDNKANKDTTADPTQNINPFTTLSDKNDYRVFAFCSTLNRASLNGQAQICDERILQIFTNVPGGFDYLETNNLPITVPDATDHFDVITAPGADILTLAEQKFSEGLFIIKDRVNAGQMQLLNTTVGLGFVQTCPDCEPSSDYVPPTGDSVAWCWKTDQNNLVNNDGTIQTDVSLNFSSGFSMMTYTGTGSTATIGHGLKKAPQFIIVKNRDHNNNSFQVYFRERGATKYLQLDMVNPEQISSARWNDTDPDNSVIHLGTATSTNGSGNRMIAYAWHDILGYSQFGQYTGNNADDGAFVYTGFRPALVIMKNFEANGSWSFVDSTRDPLNPCISEIRSNVTDGEFTSIKVDFLSNGFKLRGTVRNDAYKYVYAAWAENPFGGQNCVPVTAR